MSPVISVVFTSRGRPGDLVEVLEGLWDQATYPSELEMIVAVDPDDDATRAAEGDLPPGARLWTAPERYGYTGLHLYLNQLATLADPASHWLMWFNDDMRLLTPGWDVIVREHRDAILWPRANHVHHANIAPIWPKAWSDAAGCVSPTTHMDTWLQRVGERLGCHDRIPVEIVHDRADLTGNHDDATYHEGRFLLGPEGMHGHFPSEMLDAYCAKIEALRD